MVFGERYKLDIWVKQWLTIFEIFDTEVQCTTFEMRRRDGADRQ